MQTDVISPVKIVATRESEVSNLQVKCERKSSPPGGPISAGVQINLYKMWNKSIATASRRMIMRVGAVLLAAALLSNNQLLLVSARSLAADGSVADQQHSCAAIKGILDTIVVDHRPQPSTPSSAAAQKGDFLVLFSVPVAC